MAGHIMLLVLIFMVFCDIAYGLSILPGTIECRSLCERSFSPHTYPGNEHYLACRRGCSLKINVLGIHLQKCSKVCQEKYDKKGDVDACNLGCQMGHNISSKKVADKVPTPTAEITKPAAEEQQSTIAAMIFRPVLMLHSYGYGMINKLTYYVQSSTSYYFSTNDGGMVVVNIQNQPEVYMEADMQYGNTDEQSSNGKEQQDSQDEIRESWIIVRKGHHWLHCVSHRSGLPMWVLTSILFLSSFVLLWLCCASASSSPSAKKSAKKAFLIKDFLSKRKDDEDAPLLDLNDEQQAEPLPSKTGAAIIDI